MFTFENGGELGLRSLQNQDHGKQSSEENGAPRIKRKRLSKREMQEKRKHMATKMRKFTGLTMR